MAKSEQASERHETELGPKRTAQTERLRERARAIERAHARADRRSRLRVFASFSAAFRALAGHLRDGDR